MEGAGPQHHDDGEWTDRLAGMTVAERRVVGNEKGDYYAKVEWANDECIVFLANLLSRLKTVVCPSNLSE